jgi:hypothetical protein
MNQQALKAITSANWDELGPLMLSFAEDQIARKAWLGVPVDTKAGRFSIAGMDAEDFVEQAISKLVDGPRNYRPDLDVASNLRGTIRSDISNLHKKLHAEEPTEVTAVVVAVSTASGADDGALDDAQEFDPTSIAEAAVIGRSPPHEPQIEESRRRQKDFLSSFYNSLADDNDLQLLVMAYTEQIYKTAGIAEFTGIRPERISELKRKLRSRADKFIKNNPHYADVQPAWRSP